MEPSRSRVIGASFTLKLESKHLFYSCHTAKCPERTIREYRLEAQIFAALKQVEIRPEDQAKIREKMKNWIGTGGQKDLESSIRLRIADVKAKQDQLTDLLADGAIDKEAFKSRKDKLAFDMEQLPGELASIETNRLAFEDFEVLITIATTLSRAFEQADPVCKRLLLLNSFGRMFLLDGALRCAAASWLKGTSDGGPENLGGKPVQKALQQLGGNVLPASSRHSASGPKAVDSVAVGVR